MFFTLVPYCYQTPPIAISSPPLPEPVLWVSSFSFPSIHFFLLPLPFPLIPKLHVPICSSVLLYSVLNDRSVDPSFCQLAFSKVQLITISEERLEGKGKGEARLLSSLLLFLGSVSGTAYISMALTPMEQACRVCASAR